MGEKCKWTQDGEGIWHTECGNHLMQIEHKDEVIE